MKKVAILSPGWSLTNFVTQLAEGLLGCGIGVDIYYDDRVPQSVDIPSRKSSGGPTFIRLKEPFWPPRSEREGGQYLGGLYQEFVKRHPPGYLALIGVEKIGLALAFVIGRALRIPHVYWCLELYGPDHALWRQNTPLPDYWLKMEAQARKTALATIIQDPGRGDVLDAITGCSGKRLLLPVTVDRKSVRPAGGHALHDLCGLPRDTRILLQFGNNHLSPDWIVRMADSLPESWALVLHGLWLAPLKESLRHPKLHISAARLPEHVLPDIVASATAGLVHYPPTHINNELTAWASEKLARYLGAGVPVLAYDIGNYATLFSSYACGITYTEPQQAGPAVARIASRYELFHAMALRAGEDYFFENAGKEVLDFFRQLAEQSPAG